MHELVQLVYVSVIYMLERLNNRSTKLAVIKLLSPLGTVSRDFGPGGRGGGGGGTEFPVTPVAQPDKLSNGAVTI